MNRAGWEAVPGASGPGSSAALDAAQALAGLPPPRPPWALHAATSKGWVTQLGQAVGSRFPLHTCRE